MSTCKLPGDTADASVERAFEAPWQAQIFSMSVSLSEAGHFSWPEWVARFAQEPEESDTAYYDRWLNALEGIVADCKLIDPQELVQRQAQWREAALATPHGQPIELSHDATCETASPHVHV